MNEETWHLMNEETFLSWVARYVYYIVYLASSPGHSQPFFIIARELFSCNIEKYGSGLDEAIVYYLQVIENFYNIISCPTSSYVFNVCDKNQEGLSWSDDVIEHSLRHGCISPPTLLHSLSCDWRNDHPHCKDEWLEIRNHVRLYTTSPDWSGLLDFLALC